MVLSRHSTKAGFEAIDRLYSDAAEIVFADPERVSPAHRFPLNQATCSNPKAFWRGTPRKKDHSFSVDEEYSC